MNTIANQQNEIPTFSRWLNSLPQSIWQDKQPVLQSNDFDAMMSDAEPALAQSSSNEQLHWLEQYLNPHSKITQALCSAKAETVFGKALSKRYHSLLFKRGKSLAEIIAIQTPDVVDTMHLLVCSFFTLLSPGHSASDDQIVLKRKLSNILDLMLDGIDCVPIQEPEACMDLAELYSDQGLWQRACEVISASMIKHPDNIDMLVMLADLNRENGKLKYAINFYRQAAERQPDEPELQHDLGSTLVQDLQFKKGLQSLTLAKAGCPDNAQFSHSFRRANNLAESYSHAQSPECMPTITLDDKELEKKRLSPETLALAVSHYRRYGTLLVTNAFDPQVLEECKTQYLNEYQHYFETKKQEDALQIGHRRYQVTIALEGAFSQLDLYANPFVLELMSTLINKKIHYRLYRLCYVFARC